MSDSERLNMLNDVSFETNGLYVKIDALEKELQEAREVILQLFNVSGMMHPTLYRKVIVELKKLPLSEQPIDVRESS